MWLLILFLLLAIGVSFLCSILEAVLLSITPSYTTAMRESAPRLAGRLDLLKQNIERPLSAILTLNTIAHTVGAAGVGVQAARVFGDQSLGWVSATLTLLILVFSEIIPKTIGATFWRSLTRPTAWLLEWMVKLLYPLIWLAEMITRRIGQGHDDLGDVRLELQAMAELAHRSGHLDSHEGRILKNLLTLENIKVTSVMTPRTVVFSLPESTTVEHYASEHLDSAFSRVPLYRQEKDDIVGFVHKVDLLTAAYQQQGARTLAEFMRPLVVVPATVSLPVLFQKLLQQSSHIAAVVNEYGEFQGLVTQEDIIETLLGQEIVDETDRTVDMQSLARFKWLRWSRRSKQILNPEVQDKGKK